MEVRPAAGRSGSEGPVIKIDGGAALSDRDWIYWRLPTVSTREAFGDDRQEACVRVDRGEVRVGVISAESKLGDNWCDASKVGHALFLDTFFGVLRDGDKVVFSSARLRAAIGDVITVRLQQSTLEFCINGATVGHMPVDALRQLRMAVQMWDKGDAVFLIGAEKSGSTLGEMSSMSLAGSPIKPAGDTPLKHLPHGQGAGQGGEEETGGEKGGGSGQAGEGGTVGVADAAGGAGISEQGEGAGPAESVANDEATLLLHADAVAGGGGEVTGGGSGASDAGSGAGGGATEAPAEAGDEGEGGEEAEAGGGAGESEGDGESAAAPGGDEKGEAEGGGEGEGGSVAVAGEGGEGGVEGGGGGEGRRPSAQGQGGGEGDGGEGG